MAEVIRDCPLDEHQEAIAAEFVRSSIRSAEQRKYNDGWRYALKYRRLNAQPEPTEPQAKQKHNRELSRLSNKIVPAVKQAALPSHGAIHRLALQHIRACGGIEHFNMAQFIRDVRDLPEVQRFYRNAGRSRPLSDNAIRTILKDRLGIIGKPGRSKKSI